MFEFFFFFCSTFWEIHPCYFMELYLFNPIAMRYSILWLSHNLFIHSTSGRHLDSFQFSNIMNGTTVNIFVPVLWWAHGCISVETDRQFFSYTVPICTNFSCHGLNNISTQTTQFKFQLPLYIKCDQLQKVQTWLLALQFTNHCVDDTRTSWSEINHTSFKVLSVDFERSLHVSYSVPMQQSLIVVLPKEEFISQR